MRVRELLIGALRQGPVPQHIAFVMDGNRRFARNHGIETIEGHNLGFEALARVRTNQFVECGARWTNTGFPDTGSLLQVRRKSRHHLRILN